MVTKQSVCLRQLGGNRAGEVRLGRWLGNQKVTREEMMENIGRRTGELSKGLHVLALQDTSEVNYQHHANRVSGLGPVGNGHDLGLFIHPMLVLDANSHGCLGLAHLQQWVRLGKVGDRKKRLIEEKESYKWLEGAQGAKASLAQARMVTIIADRESDVYEEWDRIPDEKTHLLTRSCRDRKLANGQTLFKHLDEVAPIGCYAFEVKGRAGKRSTHVAHMEVRISEVEIERPQSCKDKKAQKSIKLYAIDVREHESSVRAGEEAVHWRLLTTHRIDNIEAALQCVDWYRLRWWIEQLFRTLKQQGLNIESSQVETAEALFKLVCLATHAATISLQLCLAREGQTNQAATDVFSQDEIEMLEHLQSKLEGRTQKQKNPHEKGRLAWAAWLIARLGGWKGYASEAKPGPITMLQGQQAFAAMYEGWRLAKMCA